MSSPPKTRTAFVSVHDVAPNVLDQVTEILSLFEQSAPSFRAELLVIPGLEWQPDQIDQLRNWADAGHSLVGHGWVHQSGPQKTLWHRAHSLLLSRNVAEHLSKSVAELKQIINRCFEWFSLQELPQPNMYVPPAWAMGSIGPTDLSELPFRFYESLSGYFDAETNRKVRVPLVGFEADTMFRSLGLQCFNGLNSTLAGLLARPIRVSIHPFDLSYRLEKKIRTLAVNPRYDFQLANEWLQTIKR